MNRRFTRQRAETVAFTRAGWAAGGGGAAAAGPRRGRRAGTGRRRGRIDRASREHVGGVGVDDVPRVAAAAHLVDVAVADADRVGARPALHRVGARTGVERVGPAAAAERLRPRARGQRVGAVPALDPLDVGVDVRGPVRPVVRDAVERHRRAGRAEHDAVVAVAAREVVRARQPVEPVVARPAAEPLGPGRAGHAVAARAAVDLHRTDTAAPWRRSVSVKLSARSAPSRSTRSTAAVHGHDVPAQSAAAAIVPPSRAKKTLSSTKLTPTVFGVAASPV